MRTTRRILALLALLLAGAALFGWHGGLRPSGAPAAPSAFEADDGPGTRAFLAAPDVPLRFPLTGRDRQVRLWLNANVAELEPGALLEDAYYVVRVAVLDAAGGELSATDWHHRLAVGWLAGPDGQAVPRRVYADGAVAGTPVDTNLMYVDTSAPGAQTLQIEPLPDASRPVLSVAVRAYSHQRLSGTEAQRRLQRTSATERSNLARHNVYGWSLMQPAEQANAIANRWRPLVPVGNPGLDYRETRLVLRDSDAVQVESGELPVADDVLVPGRALTFALREPRSTIDVNVTPLAASDEPQVVLTWHARLGGTVTTQVLAHGAGSALQFERGLLEVTSTAPVRLQVLGTAGVPLEPAVDRMRAWLVDAGRPLHVELAAVDSAVPLRIDARGFGDGAAAAVELAAAVRAAGDKLLPLGHWTLPAAVGRHAWVAAEPLAPVGERSRMFLLAPAGARQLEVTSTAPVLVTVSNRPPGLVRRLRVPEDLYGGALDTQLSWYLLKPVDERARLAVGGARLLTVSATPRGRDDADREVAGDDPDVEVRGERMLPLGAWRGVTVLEPLPPAARTPTGAVFAELPAAGGRVYLQADTGMDLLSPRLVLARHARQAVDVVFDGRSAGVRQRGSGWVGMQLPASTAGAHQLALAPPTRAWLSHPAPTQPGARWRERLLQNLDRELEYDLGRAAAIEETISVRVYSADASRTRVQLQLRLAGHTRRAQLVPHFSFASMDVDLRLDSALPLPVVAGPGRLEGGSGIVFLPLGHDLERAGARLRIRADSAADLYVSVLRTPAQPVARADIFTAGVVPDAP